jgi:hypothetical protein
MTELSTTFTRNRQGSPFAAELDDRLAGNEPLSSIVEWWNEKYGPWREGLGALGVKGIGPISDREMTVFCIGGSEDNPDIHNQACWGFLRKEREALRAS